MKKSILVLFLFVLSLLFFGAQNYDFGQAGVQNFLIGKAIKMWSGVLKEQRTLLVYLPDGYDQSQLKYPVLYLLDGDAHFHHVTGIVQFFYTRALGPPLIVVALPNGDRNRDFSATRVQSRPTSGGADSFLKFIREELISFVDKNYRTQPFRILAGHSLGGLFALYAFLTSPDIFNAYIAMSPSLGYDNQYLLKNAGAILEKQPSLKKFLFMTAGNEPKLIPGIEAFCKILEDKASKDLEWKYVYMEKEDHASVVHRSIYNGLEALYSKWRMPDNDLTKGGLEAAGRHFKMLSERFGYEIPVPANVYNLLGYQLIQAKKIDEAIEVFELCIQAFPDYSFAYHNLGYCYLLKGNKDLALKNLEKTLELNPDDKLAAQRLKKLKEGREDLKLKNHHGSKEEETQSSQDDDCCPG